MHYDLNPLHLFHLLHNVPLWQGDSPRKSQTHVRSSDSLYLNRPPRRAVNIFTPWEQDDTKQKGNQRALPVWNNLWEWLRTTPRQSRHTRTGRAGERRSNICSFIPAEDHVFAKQLWLQSDCTVCLCGNSQLLSVPTEVRPEMSAIPD